MTITNRTGSDLNKRKLTVENVTYDDNGNISKLIVLEERADSPTSTGTVLNAENLNLIAKGYYVDTLSAEWEQGAVTSSTFTIKVLSSTNVSITNNNPSSISISTISNTNESVIIRVSAGSGLLNLTGTGSYTATFGIKLTDVETGVVIMNKTGSIKYWYNSENPSD